MTITKSSTKFVALAAGVALALSLVFAPAFAPAQAAGLTSGQIQSILSLLSSFGADQATINNVNAALNGQATTGTGSGPVTTGAACPALTRSLQVGSSGSDVKALQVFLNSNVATQVAASGAGSPGMETSTFGPATKAAVIKFQTANGVSAIGVVGPATRAAIAAACSGTPSNPGTPGTPATGSVTVSAASQPVNTLAPWGAARVPFTTFTLTNNSGSAVTVNSVTVQRVGLGVDANFSGIELLDSNGVQIGIAKTLNSNHQANIGDTLTLGAGQSMTFTVAGDISAANAQSGQVVGLEVVAVNTSATVGGSLPIMGANQTINTTLSIGSFSTSTSAFDPGSTQTKNIGDTGVRFTALRFTASSVEDLKLYSIRWRQVGTSGSSDLANVVTNVNGTSYPTTVDSTGKYYTTVIPGGVLIPKGQSVDAYISGDIVGTNIAARTVQFNIDRGSDVYFVGQLYGFGVVDKGCSNNSAQCTNQPWFTGGVTTLQAGQAQTIGRAASVGSQNIAINIANQTLGGFQTNFTGEAVSVQTMTMSIATSSGRIPDLITGLTVVNESGQVVAGPVDATWTSSTHEAQTVVFTDTVTFPTGMHVYTIKGKLPSTATDGTSLQITVTPSNWTNVIGQTSGSNISLSSFGGFTLSAMTVKGASFTVSMSSQPGSQNVVSNASGFTFANVQLDASQSGEDIRINSIPLRVDNNTGLTGCQLLDGQTVVSSGSNVPTTLSTSAANNFVLNTTLLVPKGTIKTLSVACNLSNGSGNYTFSLSSSDTITVTGVTSGNSFSATNSNNSGGTMSVGTPSAAITVSPSSPAYALAAAGTTGVTVGKINVRASNEALTLTGLGLKLTTGAPASISALYLYNDANQLVGTVSVPLSNGSTATSSNLSVALPIDTDVVLTVKADLAGVTSVNSATTEGALIQIDPASAEVTSPSQGLIKLGASGSTAGVRVYKTFPTVAKLSPAATQPSGGSLMKFTVSADSHGPVSVGKLTFTVATSTVSLGSIGLYVTDSTGANVSQTGAVVSGLVDEVLATTTMANCTTTGGSSCSNNGSVTTLTYKPATNPIQIPANATYTFELRASTVTGATSGASVTTHLVADTSASPSSGTGTYSSLSASKFVWSPNATTTASMTSGVDWTNGYSVPGLQSDLIQGLSQ